MDEEIFPIVEPDGTVIGKATRKNCHSGSMLLHPVVHLHVIGADGTLYLQKRAMTKDIQPGRWDTAVGGHIDYGETVEQAMRREAREELGLTDFEMTALPAYVFRSDRERELINPFIAKIPAEIIPNPDPVEISEGRFWTISEIDAAIGKDIFTPNFEQEFAKIRQYLVR
jgi:isopentenyldiphosphate isomerase